MQGKQYAPFGIDAKFACQGAQFGSGKSLSLVAAHVEHRHRPNYSCRVPDAGAFQGEPDM